LKKIPISIQVIIFCDDKNILLLQRKDNPNYWQSVTGSMEKDESPKECARREVFEETGLIVNDYNFFSLNQMNQYQIYPEWKYRYDENVSTNIEHLFALQLHKKEHIIINPQEHIEYIWTDLEDAIKKVFSWTNRNALINFKKFYE
jgi:dATP pyrophosphohydrolase